MTTWHPHHIAERYGLFTIILLGETIAVLAAGIGDIVSAGERIVQLVIVGASALVLIFGLWWSYFLQPTGAGLAANRRGAFFWGYGHYFVFAALGALGAGLEVILKLAVGKVALSAELAGYAIAVPVAIYLVALLITHLRILPGIIVHVRVIVPAAVIVLFLPIATGVLGLITIVALISLVVALVVAITMARGRRMHGPGLSSGQKLPNRRRASDDF
jgi:low temperature requirement protein LtrA